MHDTEMSTVPDGLVDTPPVPKPQGVGLAPIVEEVHHRAADLATFSASPGMLGAGPQGVAPIGGQESASLPLPYMGSDTALSPPKIGSGPSKGESETRPGQIPSYTTGTAMYSQTLFPNLLDGLAEERKELALLHAGGDNPNGSSGFIPQTQAERILLLPEVARGKREEKFSKKVPRGARGERHPYPYPPRNNRRFPGSGSMSVDEGNRRGGV